MDASHEPMPPMTTTMSATIGGIERCAARVGKSVALLRRVAAGWRGE
ncbi:hypothetical protein [Micromonospora andamanensis]|nr:hypothetical protein [Micromonospora andamanensis]